MRLFLGGGGNKEDSVELDRRFVASLNLSKPLLYIPIAMDTNKVPFEKCFKWFKSVMNPLGITNIHMWTEISNEPLEKYCGIYIGGGNTFKLLHEFTNSGFSQRLISAARKDLPIYGGSAGAIIFGNNIASAFKADQNEVGLTQFQALGLITSFDIACHYVSNLDGQLIELQRKYSLKSLLAIPENGGIQVSDGKIQVVGPGSVYVLDGKEKKEFKPSEFVPSSTQ